MFSKKERVKKKKDFEYIFKKGDNFSNPFFILKKKENNLSFSRFAFIAPSKIFSTAVEKNKAKRKIKEGVKEFYPLIKKGFDLIFIARKKGTFLETRENLKDVLNKAKLI